MKGIAVVRGLLVGAGLITAACGRISFDARATSVDGNGAADSDDAEVSDTGIAGFCGTVPAGYAVCSTFDTGDVADGWTSTQTGTTGVVTTDTGLAVSPPASLATLFPTQPTQALEFADLLYDAGVASGIQLRTSVYLPQRPTATYEMNSINTFVPGVGNFYNDIDIAVSGADRWRQEYVPATGPPGMAMTLPMMVAITPGVWHDVVIDVDFSAQMYLVTIDGAKAIEGQFLYPIAQAMTTVQVGPNYVNPGISGADVYQDNVVIYVVP